MKAAAPASMAGSITDWKRGPKGSTWSAPSKLPRASKRRPPGLTDISRPPFTSSTALPPVTGEAGGIRSSAVSWSDAFPFTEAGDFGS
jgi:hypothetical protein